MLSAARCHAERSDASSPRVVMLSEAQHRAQRRIFATNCHAERSEASCAAPHRVQRSIFAANCHAERSEASCAATHLRSEASCAAPQRAQRRTIYGIIKPESIHIHTLEEPYD